MLTCFLRNMFNHYSPTLINGAVQPQRNVELVGYNCAGEIPTFCKIQTGRNGSYHSSSHRSKFCSKTICFRSRILFSRTSALQSGIHRDEKEGTSIDDEFTKQKLTTYMWLCLIFIVNSRCSTYNVIVTMLRKKMLETTNEKSMHSSSSSASVRKFDTSKLVV